MASTQFFIIDKVFLIAAVVAVIVSVTTALPLSDIVKRGMEQARADMEEMQEGLERAHSVHKRDASTVSCPQPSNIDQMFQSINTNVSKMSFFVLFVCFIFHRK
jgi:Tfp pilus assembly protein PilE